LKLEVLVGLGLALLLVACGSSQPLFGVSRTDVARFLTHATFGPSKEEIDALWTSHDYEGWLRQQKDAPPSLELPYLQQTYGSGQITQGDGGEAWLRFALTGPDQLRQRMAFALSEIMVVSVDSVLSEQPEGTAYYYDLLAKNALGNFRDLLEDVTLSPAMATFLTMIRNQKPDPVHGVRSDENYAREVMQLFTIGLVQLNADGTPRLDANGRTVPTFDQRDVANLSHVFTGWSWAGGTSDQDFFTGQEHWTQPLQPYEDYHDESAKVIVGNTSIPAGMHAQEELDLALDTLFQHPNVGPFISKQLIQRLVTSNPSPAYVARVTKAFNDNGHGVRGDLFAVARAILLDPEAHRGPSATSGKLREPLLRLTNVWRAFHAAAQNGRYNYVLAPAAFDQSPLDAPSVFNFFRPTSRPLGVISHAGLVAPEFDITTETTTITGSNELRRVAGLYRTSQGPDSASQSDILLDFRPWEDRAAQVDQLVDGLNDVLMRGEMPAAMRQTLIDAIGTIPPDRVGDRIAGAVYLVVSSPQAAVED